nr:ribonuclease H-like domain-containing protein [Tanacetum cinerariifolium]
MTDLGALNYFLGISGTRHSTWLFLSQKEYAIELLALLQVVFNISHLLDQIYPMQFNRFASTCMTLVNLISLPLIVYYPTFEELWILDFTCTLLLPSLLLGSSKCQQTIARSSAEAEYRGVANVVAETAWLRNLLRELHYPLSATTLVYYDDVSATYLSANPVQHQRTKHIEIDIHFVHDLVTAGQV